MEDFKQDPLQRQGEPASLAPILASAHKAKLSKAGVAALAQEMSFSSTDACAAIRAAIQERDGHAATALLIGATVNGYRPDTLELTEIFPLLTDIRLMAPLLGCCTGDRIKMLIELLESGRMSWEREALACLLAVVLLGDAQPPPNLLVQMRLLAREDLMPESGLVLGCAAMRVQDPATRQVADLWIQLARHSGGDGLVATTQEMLAMAPAEALSDEEAHPLAGIMLRRAAPRIGRNDPCPCGSGRKYKKCCADKDAARLADPSPVAGVTMSEYMDHPEAYLDRDQFDNLGVREVARLDYSRLETLCVIKAVRILTTHRFWAEAERAMEVLSSRTEFPMGSTADGYRAELIANALSAGARDVVERQVARIQDPNKLDYLRMNLELFTPSQETLDRMEEVVRAHLHETEQDGIIDLTHALLDRYPALGILMTRGILDPDRALDMEFLLEDVERARDRLQLSPGDVAHDIYEHLIESDLDFLEQEDENYADAATEKLAASAAEQRARLREASAKVASLEKKLRAQEELLCKVKAERFTTPPPPRPAKAVVPAPVEGEELKRLRGKVEELKGLIAEGQKERKALRVKLAEVTSRMEKSASDRVRDHEGWHPTVTETERESAEIDAGMPGRWSTLIPSYRSTAREAVRSAPTQLAHQALQTVAALAAGDQTAWSGIKKLRAIPEVWSARIGLHYRLLFRLDFARSTLEVTAFIHRRDLESTIAKGGL